MRYQPEEDIYQPLLIQRTKNVPFPINELLVVTCCGPEEDNANAKYHHQSAALAIAAYLTPYQHINWTAATRKLVMSICYLPSFLYVPLYYYKHHLSINFKNETISNVKQILCIIYFHLFS